MPNLRAPTSSQDFFGIRKINFFQLMDVKEGTVEADQNAINSVQDVTDNKHLQCPRRSTNQGKGDRLSMQACTMWCLRRQFNLVISRCIFGENGHDSHTRNHCRSVKALNKYSILQQAAGNCRQERFMHLLTILCDYTYLPLLKTHSRPIFQVFPVHLDLVDRKCQRDTLYL